MFLKDILYPKFCLSCGKIGSYFCLNCQKTLKPLTQDFCLYCKKPSLYGLTHFGCQKKYSLDGKIAIFYYNPTLKKLIKNIKYRLVKEAWKEFSLSIKPEFLYKLDFYKKINHCFFQPIPLIKKKLQLRGFNQVDLLISFFQKFVNFSKVDLLEKIKDTPAQAEIKDLKLRRKNVKNCYSIKRHSLPLNSRIILVDDLVTTGSTAQEACRVLKKNGFQKVYLLTLAQG